MEKKESNQRLSVQRNQKRFQRSSSKVFRSGFGVISPKQYQPATYNPYEIQSNPSNFPLKNNSSIGHQLEHKTGELVTSQHSLTNTSQKLGFHINEQRQSSKTEPEQVLKPPEQLNAVYKSECKLYKFVPAKDNMYGDKTSKINLDKSLSSRTGTIKKKFEINNQPSLLQKSIHISQNSQTTSKAQKLIKNQNISYLANKNIKTSKNTTIQNKQNVPDTTKSQLRNFRKISDFLGKNSKEEKTQKKIDYWGYAKCSKNNPSIFDKTEELKTTKIINQNEGSFTSNQKVYENKIAQLQRQNSELKSKNKTLSAELSKLQTKYTKIQNRIKDLPSVKIKEYSNKVSRLKENEQEALLNEIKMIQSYKQIAQQNIISDLKQQIDQLARYIDGCGDRSTNMDSIMNDLFKQNSQLKQQVSGLNLKLWAIDKKNSSKWVNEQKIRKLELENRYNKATLKESSTLIQKLKQQNDKLRKQSRKAPQLEPRFSSNKFLDNSSLSLSFSLC